ncbi:putative AbiEii toxin of type IV toxin-antitoxin system [Lentzea atacamensis]|uniref:AbiEii toxin of type IV toxin-antitoxin system n=1 Tax=Lentzea atacamensis TaxID=531938 RepID=A0ABX9EG12_9PSEU|nr:AAA family ATPase [Lentzea atacamensis]RAS68452.1 putative AbiEii toxin of type IV toxin-antitoxin system [Lentzea atacamensis]
MRLIQAVRIENFRSIRFTEVKDVDEYNPIVGLNSSGKSNLLRALNLFFNSVVDERYPNLSMVRDFSSYAPAGKKKYVSVSVQLDLTKNFKVRKQDDFLEKHQLSDSIAIQRTWTIDAQTQSVVEAFSFGPDLDNLTPADSSNVPNLLLFIRAIKFRYIPNHTQPSDLIREYAQPLRSELIRRLQGTQEYKQGEVEHLMRALARTGDQMFTEVSKNVGSGISSLSVSPALPTDFAELAFDVAIQSVSNGSGRSPEFEGSGAQAFILLHFLDLVDRVSRGRAFGWVQASIWALEEPESFLHAGLRNRFAQDLFIYAADSRRQVFLTTHQDEFVRVASNAWMATQTDTGTRIDDMPAKAALTRSARLAITTYRHPLLEYPDQPMVVVEGAFDEVHIGAAAREAGIRPRWRLVSPDSTFGAGTAGDALKQYLKYNQTALASRPSAAPVLIVRDWESKDINSYKTLTAIHGYSEAMIAPQHLLNPALGPSFAGVERYLSTSLIESTIEGDHLLVSKGAKGTIEIRKESLSDAKKKLATAVQDGAAVGTHAVQLAKWVDTQVSSLIAKIPASEFFI